MAQRIVIRGAVFLLCMVAAACSKPSYIDIMYRLPDETDVLKGRQVSLEVQDMRSDTDIFAGAAQEEYAYFTGIFSLSLEKGESSYIIGTYELPELFHEALKRRMESLGVQVRDGAEADVPKIEVLLNTFLLEGAGRKWLADIRYDARLVEDGAVLATQSISGKAERTKLIGHGDAEKALGEIFTESVNKFDIAKLFEKAER